MRPASALRRSPGPRCACRRGRGGGGVVPAAGGRGWFPVFRVFVGVSCGFFLFGFVPVFGAVSRVFCRAAVRALVAVACGVGAGCWCAALAGSRLAPVVLRRGCGRRVRVAGGCVGVRCCVVGLVRFPGRGSALRGRGVRRLGSGRGAAVAAALSACRAPGSRRVGGRLVVSLPPLPVLVARVAGCRWRWLVRGGARCLAVRCASPALAALLCRRARAFGLPPVRAGRRGLLVLLPSARVAPLPFVRRVCPFLSRSRFSRPGPAFLALFLSKNFYKKLDFNLLVCNNLLLGYGLKGFSVFFPVGSDTLKGEIGETYSFATCGQVRIN